MLSRVSATQVTTYKACPRKWWNGYVLRIREPEKPSALLGTKCHSILEHYSNTGEFKSDDEHLLKYVAPALANIPPPQTPGVQIEQKFEIPTYLGGPMWIGYIDQMWHSPPKHATIIDHKTRSDLRYCAKPEELMVDVQLASYAKAATLEWPTLESVTVAHNYILTPRPGETTEQRKPKSRFVSADLNRPQIEMLWDQSMDTVREMVALEALGPEHPVQEIPPNTNECSKYGGCFYRKQCGFVDPKNPPLFNFLNARPEPKPMSETNGVGGTKIISMKDRLAAARAKAGGAPAQAASTPAAQTAPATESILPEDSTPDVASLPQEPAEAAPAAADAPKRGRPAKAKPQAPAGEAVPQAVAAEGSKPTPAANPSKSFILLVNAVPTKGYDGAVLFDDWFAPALAAMALEHKVPHFMLLDFGKQKAAVVVAVQQLAAKGLPSVLVVYTRTPGAEEALAALTPFATAIVRA